MPDPAKYDNEKDWMAACVPVRIEEGNEQKQAVAACLNIWREKSMTTKATKNPGDYLVVEDPQKPSTFHLQVKVNGKPDHRLMGAAWAALHGGYRGNRYEGPDKAAAISKLKKLYASEGMETPKSLPALIVIGTKGVFPIKTEEDATAAYISAFRESQPDAMQQIIALANSHGWQTAISEAKRRTKALAAGDSILALDSSKIRKKVLEPKLPSKVRQVVIDGDTKALEFDMLLTKSEQMSDGRTRWQARANTGDWDLENERFDKSFWDDVIYNFARVQEETSKGGCCGMPVPILDIAHYSFRLPEEKRNLARAGYPIKLWQDGQALMAQGYFDDTPLGRAAAKAAASRPVSERRVSVGVWPDWGRVELDKDGRRTYKGGRNRAYLDHLAMTGHPIDPGTVLEVKAMSQKQDAIDVLGDSEEALALVDELEEATTKAMPDGVVVKADEEEPEAEVEKADEESEPEEQPEPVSADQLRNVLEQLFNSFGEQLNERLAPMETAMQDIPELKAQIDALQATETEKVKAAIDSDGDLWTQLVKNSVQRREPVEDEGPEEKSSVDPNDPFYRMFGGLTQHE